QSGGQWQSAPLKLGTSGRHYNAITSVRAFNLTGAFAAVQLVNPPNIATLADAMLTVAPNGSSHYRMYLEHGTIGFEKKLSGAKTIVGSVPYSPSANAFWRIRHDAT